jgi:hypothetical protein
MSMAQLGDLCREFGVEYEATDDLWTRLTKCVKHVLDPSEEDLVAILETRVSGCTPSEWLSFIKSSDADTLFDKDDQRLRQVEVNRVTTREERGDEFMKKYVDLRQRVATAKATALAKGKGRGRGGRGKAAAAAAHPKEGARLPKELAPHQCTLAWVKEWMPLGALLQRDTFNGAWECNVFGVRRSRSWRLWGVGGAAAEILRVAWELAKDHGMERPWDFEE